MSEHGGTRPHSEDVFGEREEISTALLAFESHVRHDAAGCWLWQGWKRAGYGRWRWGGDKGIDDQAHRWSWVFYRGALPLHAHLHHICGNRLCVNPAHLKALTPHGHGKLGGRPLGTVCGKGHAWTLENTYRFPDGRRACRTCRGWKARTQQRYCKSGHELTAENVYLYRRAGYQCRRCRQCHMLRQRLYAERAGLS